MILHKSKDSESSSSESDPSLSDLKDVHSTDTMGVEELCHASAPDDSATHQPFGNTTDFLQDHVGLQEVHKELVHKKRGAGLNPVLCGHVVCGNVQLIELVF